MRIPDLYAQAGPTVSFELFPPKTEAAEGELFEETIPALARLRPSFFSATYGAGGGTRDRTLRIVNRIRRDFGVEAMPHLTCVGSTREMLAGVLDEAQSCAIDNVLALRGDPPKGQKEFRPAPGGFAHAIELVRFVKGRNAFAIGVAGYPEGHIECPDRQLDWDRTAAKVEAGADFIITQLFYEADHYLAFADYLRNRRGVTVPIVPGVLPFLSAEQIKRFTTLCGATLPADLRHILEHYAHDDASVRQIGVDVCTALCQKLLDHGVRAFHFYTLNRVAGCAGILRNLGLGYEARDPEPTAAGPRATRPDQGNHP